MNDGIAIIGAAGRFPGAADVGTFWRNLCAGMESISFFSDEQLRTSGVAPHHLANPHYVNARGILDGIELFDAEFFGMNPREAEITDPQQRLFLECAWQALETAGYNPDTYQAPIGVYAGTSLSNYLFLLNSSPELVELVGSFQIEIGNDKDFLSTRTSYKLNLSGPSVNVNTACSTSLVAVTLACQSLLTFQCDMALAGGVAISIPECLGYIYDPGGILSPDGHCRAFDAKAQGTVGGNGAAIVVLKRLEDAIMHGDEVMAVIKGFAINNDGAKKVGFTAPSIDGQANVIQEAMAHARIDPETVTYIEAHGTGTNLGDPIEIEALTRAFRIGTDKKQFCAIGSVKTNIGHLDTAAGVAGLIKAALAIKHGLIPPSLHYEQPNPQIDFANSPFYVNSHLQPWKPEKGPRRAGVSSFGIGGTNVHVVLEEAPAPSPPSGSRKAQVVVLSARTEGALRQAAGNLQEHLEYQEGEDVETPLADVAYTLAVGRRNFPQRLAVVCEGRRDAVGKLRQDQDPDRLRGEWHGSKRAVALLFSGQGSQYVQMGRNLYDHEVVFREEVDRCSEYLTGILGLDLRRTMWPREGEEERATELLNQTWLTQPALCVLERGLLKQWESWGIEASAMLGHSLGELVAASAAGVLSVEDALRLAAFRGRLMWQTQAGAMLSALLGEEHARHYEREGISIAAVNGREQVVFSGGPQDISQLENKLKEDGIASTRLLTSRAFHSQKMDPIREELLDFTNQLKLRAPQKRYVSCVTGTWAGEEVTKATYWWELVRGPVRFADGIGALLQEGEWTWLELGPGSVLGRLVEHELRASGQNGVVAASLPGKGRNRQEDKQMATALAQLWTSGVDVDWTKYYFHERRRRVPLPTYPFQRESYWINLAPNVEGEGLNLPPESRNQTKAAPSTSGSILHSRPPHLHTGYIAPLTKVEIAIAGVWEQLLGIDGIGLHDNFFEIGGHSLLVVQMAKRLSQTLGREIALAGFLAEPTIAGLAKIVGFKGDGHFSNSVLAPMRTTGTKPAFFAVHPIGGGGFIFMDLVRHLGADQPFYALQASDLVDVGTNGDPYPSLEEMAAAYLVAIREVQPRGPYFLGGLSWGGVLAVEMAQQLNRTGEEVRLLALFDTPSPENLGKLDQLQDAAILVGLARDLGFQRGIELPLSVDKIQPLSPEQQFASVLSELQQCGLLPPEATTGLLRHQLRGYRSRLGLVRNYHPRIYRGQITFFGAASLDEVMSKHLDEINMDYHNPARSWQTLSTEPIETHTIPGNHTEIVFEPNVQVLADHLGACIAKLTPCAA